MSEIVQQIKDKLSVVEVLKGYIQVSPAGKNFKARCPFHQEKTPSFVISPERQIWHCFGCGAGGDIVGFLMRYENLEFTEALRILAEKAGIDLRRFGTSDQKQYDRLYQINRAAADFFKQQLALSSSKGALEYFKNRGLKNETVEEFELGFAPDGSDVLARHLAKLGYQISEIEKVGLVFKTERGSYMDRFRGRLMFPLCNSFGKVVGFTGRIMPEYENAQVGKYINSPETPLFNKSKILFGLHKSKNAIRESGAAVLVEGQMDFLMTWQDGVKNVVATSGTALTGEHLHALKRVAENLIISFDGDEAGQLATERTIDAAQAMDFVVKIANVSFAKANGMAVGDCKDPADVVRSYPGLMAKMVSVTQPAMEYYFQRYIPATAKIEKSGLRFLLAKIKSIYSPVERGYWLKELSGRVNIAENLLWEELAIVKVQPLTGESRIADGAVKKEPEKTEFSRKDLISQRLLSMAAISKDFTAQLKDSYQYLPEVYQKISEQPGQSSELASLISMRSSLELSNLNNVRLSQEFVELGRQLKIEYLKEKRDYLVKVVREAEGKKDQVLLAKLLVEFDNVSKQLHNI